MNHKSIKIEYSGRRANVDCKIAKLILMCWQCGIDTDLSCENNVPKNWIWICFHTARDAERFISIVGVDKENEIYDRIYQEWDIKSRKKWRYNINLCDLSQDFVPDEKGECVEIKSLGPSCALMSVSIRFPYSDLKYVEKMFENKLKNV